MKTFLAQYYELVFTSLLHLFQRVSCNPSRALRSVKMRVAGAYKCKYEYVRSELKVCIT